MNRCSWTEDITTKDSFLLNKMAVPLDDFSCLLTTERFPIICGEEREFGRYNFFDQFNAASRGWSEADKIATLRFKLMGRAKNIFGALPLKVQANFKAVIEALQKELSNADSIGFLSFNNLLFRKRRSKEKSLETFAEGIDQVVWRVVSVDCLGQKIDRLYGYAFLSYLNDQFTAAPYMTNPLLLCRGEPYALSFRPSQADY